MHGEESSCPLSATKAAASQQEPSSAEQIAYCVVIIHCNAYFFSQTHSAQNIYKLNASLKLNTKNSFLLLALPTREKKNKMFLFAVCFPFAPRI